MAQLGSPRRLRIIYDTNLRMNHAAGEWAKIQRTKQFAPFLRYVAILDGRTRPLHRGWHGTILPVDHAFWKTHYPPNGWRCRCTVQQLSQMDLDDFGYQVSPDPLSMEYYQLLPGSPCLGTGWGGGSGGDIGAMGLVQFQGSLDISLDDAQLSAAAGQGGSGVLLAVLDDVVATSLAGHGATAAVGANLESATLSSMAGHASLGALAATLDDTVLYAVGGQEAAPMPAVSARRTFKVPASSRMVKVPGASRVVKAKVE